MARPSKRGHSLWQTINNISFQRNGWLNRKIQTEIEGALSRKKFQRQQRNVNFLPSACDGKILLKWWWMHHIEEKEVGCRPIPKSNIFSCCQGCLSVVQICCSHIFLLLLSIVASLCSTKRKSNKRKKEEEETRRWVAAGRNAHQQQRQQH